MKMSKDNLYKQFFDRLDFILDYTEDYNYEWNGEMIVSQLQPDNYFTDEELIELFKKIKGGE